MEQTEFFTQCGMHCIRQADGRWRVVPFGDFNMIFDSAFCVTDDFGNLVRVPS